ncbi:hypothetical protein LAB1_05230 [Roseibium sp. LAB1]
MVGIFRFQVGADIGVKHGRVFHDLLPIVRPQPGVVVLAGNAVSLKGDGARIGAGGEGILFHGSEVRFLSPEGKRDNPVRGADNFIF